MKALVFVAAFWLAVALILAWALGLRDAIDGDQWFLIGVLVAPVFVLFSAFLWLVGKAMIDDLGL